MKKIAIVTDTDCSIPLSISEKYAIRQVPITIHFGEQTYTTHVDIDDRRLFELVDRYKKLPTTAAPSPGAFAAAYQAAFEAGADAIVCICVSSKVSATYQSALTACDSFPGREILVIDSLNLIMGQGFMALAAAEAAASGASVAEVAERVEDVGRRVHVFALLSTLKYLALSGRVGKLAAGMADTLNIKPILTVRDGSLVMLEKIRSHKKAAERMLELVEQSLNGKQIERLALVHVNNLEGAQEFQQLLAARLPCPEPVIIADFTPGLSVHGGAGVVAVVVVEK